MMSVRLKEQRVLPGSTPFSLAEVLEGTSVNKVGTVVDV